MTIKSPFPWFGGKSRVAPYIWQRFGDVKMYIEPFFGSGAALLSMPSSVTPRIAINDLDGFVANFWRSIQHSPDETAKWATNPINENDLHARHSWLVQHLDTLRPKLEGNPDYHDPRIAGYWVWCVSSWFGLPCCSGKGPWVVDENGMLVKRAEGDTRAGVTRQLPCVHSRGTNRGVPPEFADRLAFIISWFRGLSDILQRAIILSGDWSRVVTSAVLHSAQSAQTNSYAITGVFLDPPYADTANRASDVYAQDSLSVAHDVRKWAIEHGRDKRMRIALCGYEGEHEMPADWETFEWKAKQGFSNRGENSTKERIWFSPGCLSGKAWSGPRVSSKKLPRK